MIGDDDITRDGKAPEELGPGEPAVEALAAEEPADPGYDCAGADGDASETAESFPSLAKTRDDAAGLPDDVLLSRIESVVFVAPEPVTVRRLARLLGVDGKRTRALLDVLIERYRDRGILLEEVSGGFQFRSNPANAAVIREMFKVKPLRLSRPALETLAIVAYRQPVTRAEVEDIRGVDSGAVLKFLFEKGLVRVLGRKEEPGRPIIYGTGPSFLEMFGLKSLADLPALHEFTDLWDEHKTLVDEETGPEEEPADANAPEAAPEAGIDEDEEESEDDEFEDDEDDEDGEDEEDEEDEEDREGEAS